MSESTDSKKSVTKTAAVIVIVIIVVLSALGAAVRYGFADGAGIVRERELGPQGSADGILEVGVRLLGGGSLGYSFFTTPSGSVSFNIHSHFKGVLQVHIAAMTPKLNGTFVAPRTGDYYLMWENLEERKVKVVFTILPPLQVYRVIHDGASYEVSFVSDSEIYDVSFQGTEGILRFMMRTADLTGGALGGFVNVTFPKRILDGEFRLFMDWQEMPFTLVRNLTHVSIFADVDEGIHQLSISVKGSEIKGLEVPPTPVMAALTAVAALLVIVWSVSLRAKKRRGRSPPHTMGSGWGI